MGILLYFYQYNSMQWLSHELKKILSKKILSTLNIYGDTRKNNLVTQA